MTRTPVTTRPVLTSGSSDARTTSPAAGLTTGEIVVNGVPRRRLRGTDVHVYPVALGGSTFGWTADAPATQAILDRYSDAGGNFVSVSDHYSSGRAEVLLGTWIRHRGNRDQLVVATTAGRAPEFADGRAASIIAATEASLARLGLDHIDLLGLYGIDDDIRIEEALAAGDALIRSGKVRHLIANDYSADRLLASRISAAHLGAPQFVALSTTYNLAERQRYETQLEPVVSVQTLSVIPKHALAGGFLSGKFRSRQEAAKSARGTASLRFMNRAGFRLLQALEAVAAEQQKPLSTIALAWLLSKPHVLSPEVSVASPEQVAGLVAAAGVHLSRHQVSVLDAAGAYRR